MKKVITYGTFDLLHKGHLNILKRAKNLGDYLVVGLSTEPFNHLKGKQAYHSYEHRKATLATVKYVDQIIPEENWYQKVSDIKKYNINVFVMGDDWLGKFDDLQKYCDVIYLPRTDGVSSSQIKRQLLDKKR